MCLICVHFEQEKLTTREAWGNLAEMRDSLDEKHIEEVENMIIDAEAENIKVDLEALFADLDDEDNPFDFNFGGCYDYLGTGEEE